LSIFAAKAHTLLASDMKILICEDQEILLTLIEFKLKKQGFSVIRAKNGRQAIEQIHQEHPQLVVMGVEMPYINGIQLITYIREEMASQLPILLISATENEDTVLEGFRRGANDFILKPFRPEELILRIRKILD
jgi:two-component system, OmpR family, response regulator VicR